ncbi:unnamed protein product [Rhizophagus irregularis]|nr:unnamed protein product [Rhizophagus irregularis]
MKCWDAKAENRPTAKELYEILEKWKDEMKDENTELYSQIKECNEISKSKFKKKFNRNNDDESENVQSAYNNPELTYNSDNDNNIQSDSSSEYLLSESEKPRNLWKNFDWNKYQAHVNVTSTNFATKSEEINDSVIYMDDLEKRKEVYGICGECKEPGTGYKWCQSCNAKRFKDNFKNWTSENKDIDEFIQQSQLNSVHNSKCLEWIPFEKFQNITYIAEGGFAIKICKGLRPTISKDVPMLLADLIIKCWDAEIENRPTTKELYQILTKWNDEIEDIEGSEDSEYSEDDEDGEDSENGEKSEYNGDGEDGEDGENVKDSENCDNSQNNDVPSVSTNLISE